MIMIISITTRRAGITRDGEWRLGTYCRREESCSQTAGLSRCDLSTPSLATQSQQKRCHWGCRFRRSSSLTYHGHWSETLEFFILWGCMIAFWGGIFSISPDLNGTIIYCWYLLVSLHQAMAVSPTLSSVLVLMLMLVVMLMLMSLPARRTGFSQNVLARQASFSPENFVPLRMWSNSPVDLHFQTSKGKNKGRRGSTLYVCNHIGSVSFREVLI